VYGLCVCFLVVSVHCKKELTVFPSPPAGMSLILTWRIFKQFLTKTIWAFHKKIVRPMFVCMYTNYQSISRLFRPPPFPQAPPPPPHPPLPVPEELLSRTSNIRSFKKLLTLQSEFKMSSFQPVFSGKYYILNISLLWSLFETFNFFNLKVHKREIFYGSDFEIFTFS
jgi:hypothetical protein